MVDKKNWFLYFIERIIVDSAYSTQVSMVQWENYWIIPIRLGSKPIQKLNTFYRLIGKDAVGLNGNLWNPGSNPGGKIVVGPDIKWNQKSCWQNGNVRDDQVPVL